MHHGKLDLRQPISASYGSRDYVLTIAGLKLEVPDEFPSLSPLTSWFILPGKWVGIYHRGSVLGLLALEDKFWCSCPGAVCLRLVQV